VFVLTFECGPLWECLRARRFQTTLLLHTACVGSWCNWRATSVAGKHNKKSQPNMTFVATKQNQKKNGTEGMEANQDCTKLWYSSRSWGAKWPNVESNCTQIQIVGFFCNLRLFVGGINFIKKVPHIKRLLLKWIRVDHRQRRNQPTESPVSARGVWAIQPGPGRYFFWVGTKNKKFPFFAQPPSPHGTWFLGPRDRISRSQSNQ